MKKCAYCGLLNEDTTEACDSCGFTGFDEKPRDHGQVESKRVPSVLSAERRGTMVTLKCRTPAEACLVRDNLESEDVIALVPSEEQMLLQYKKNGYVELQIPGDAYDSTGDLRSAVAFSTSGPPAGLLFPQKLSAALLGFFIVPGLLILAWQLTSLRKKGLEKEASEVKGWFLVGVGSWVLLFVALLIF